MDKDDKDSYLNSYLLGVLTMILAIVLFTSIRGCVRHKLYDIKDGRYGYKGLMIEGESVRDVYVSNNGDGRIV